MSEIARHLRVHCRTERFPNTVLRVRKFLDAVGLVVLERQSVLNTKKHKITNYNRKSPGHQVRRSTVQAPHSKEEDQDVGHLESLSTMTSQQNTINSSLEYDQNYHDLITFDVRLHALSLYRNRLDTLLVAVDLSAAFDAVEHSVLLSRLENSFGVCGQALQWVRSYLTDRSEFDRFESATAEAPTPRTAHVVYRRDKFLVSYCLLRTFLQ